MQNLHIQEIFSNFDHIIYLDMANITQLLEDQIMKHYSNSQTPIPDYEKL